MSNFEVSITLNIMKNIITILTLVLLLNKTYALDKTTNEYLNASVSHEVYFDTNQYDITTREYRKLLEFLDTVEDVDIDRMVIYGFCDDRGSIDYNKKLSNSRAQAVKDIILKFRNKEPKVLNIDGKGEIQLDVNEEALLNDLRKLNRKVVISILPKKLIADTFYGEDLKAGDLINIKKLKFKKGVRHLTPESIETLKELTDFLIKRTDIYFTLNGHVCCTEGGREAKDRQTGKKNLSLVRAKYIRNYLVRKGVDPQRIKCYGLAGKFRHIIKNKTTV